MAQPMMSPPTMSPPAMSQQPPAFVAVLDRSDALVHGLSKAVEGLDGDPDVHLFTRARDVQAVFEEGPVDVLLVGPSEMTVTGLRRVARWHHLHPSTVVLVASERDALPDQLLLMRAGAQELLKLPAGPAAIRRALAGALDLAERRRQERLVELQTEQAQEAFEIEDGADELELMTQEPAPPPPLPVVPAVTITVASATGGCGKTFLATNLAFLLARGTGKRVALVDLDLQFGEVVATLQLRPTRTIAEVEVAADGSVEVDHLMTHHEGGFDVLAAPTDPIVADALRPSTVTAVLEAVRERYDYVIVDTPPALNEVVLGAFDVSDHLIVLATLDVPSVRNMKVFLSTLERLKIASDGLHLVLNKAEKNVELTAGDVVKALGRPWDLELPYDREVSRSVNLGLPVAEAAPSCQVSKRLIAGVSALVPGVEMTPVEEPADRNFLHRLLAAIRPSRGTFIYEEKMP